MIMSEQLFNPFNFSGAKVLVVGKIALDTYWFSSTNRTSPEAPVPIAHYSHAEHRLAGSGLIAAIIKKLCSEVNLITTLGVNQPEHVSPTLGMSNNDVNSKIKELLEQHEIVSDHVLTHPQKTLQRIRVVSHAQQLLRIDSAVQSPADLDDESDAVNQKFVELYKQANIIIFYDTHSKNYKKWQQLAKQNKCQTIYIPGSAQSLSNFIKNDYSADYIITENDMVSDESSDVLAACHTALVAYTKQGLTMYHKQDQTTTITNSKAVDCSVTNTIGNLEMIGAIFALGIHSCGATADGLVRAMEMANAAKLFADRQLGQCTIGIVELQLAYADCMLSSKYNYINLQQEIIAARAKQQKIVFANGCFDVLHIGHVAYLEAAKARGDKLFIGINSDCSIKRLKGESRPINNLADRLLVLKSLDFQDWVVPFYTDTPEDFLRWLKPDLLVKGGDYTLEGIVGHEIVHAYGGKTEIIKHDYNNISSSKILADTTHV